jgi:PAS domain S-box-containing protein
VGSEDTHYRSLFEDSPIPLWEEDFSRVKQHLDALRESGVSDFAVYFAEHPEAVRQCAALVRIVNVNQATLKMHEASSKKCLLKSLDAVFTPETYGTFREALIALSRGVTNLELESTARTLPGKVRNTVVKWSVAPGCESTLHSVLVSVMDITDSRQAERELRESEERLRILLEGVQDYAIIMLDAEGRVASWNAGAERILGYRAEEIVGRHVSTFCPPEDIAQGKPAYKLRVAATEGRFEEEGLRVRKDGTGFWGHAVITALRDEHGRLRGFSKVTRDITERKRTEGALRRSEALLAEAERIAGLGSWEWDIARNQLRWSDEVYRIFGLTPQSFGATYDAFLNSVHPDDRGVVSAAVNAALQGQEPYSITHRVVRPDGSELVVHERGEVTCNEGQPVRMVGTVHDITERKRAEEALAETTEKLGAVIEASPLAIVALDGGGLITMWNTMAERIFGWTQQEVLGRPPPFVPPDMKQEFRRLRERIKTGEALTGVELRRQRRDRAWVDLSLSAAPLRDAEERVVGLVGVMEDITERKKAEAERTRLLTAIEQTTEGIAITNTQGDIEYVNPGFTNITGYTREEVQGQNPRFLKSGKHDEKFYTELWRTITAGRIWQGEIINRRQDGTHYTEWMTITPVRDQQGEVTNFIAIKEDITERKQLAEQLRQAQKMEAVGRLAGGIAHDFNNVLMVIRGYSELLHDKLRGTDRLSAMTGEIQQAADRATGLVRQLLAFSRKQVLQPQVLSLNTVVTNIEKMLQRLIGEDIELATALTPSLGCVKADPGQLEQAIMNLAVNARDAMPDGGRLTIETSDVDLDESYAQQRLGARPGSFVLLAVTDTGHGMDKETQARIFEPFFTTKEKGKGTGLGLATVYGIVKQSGGYIWVYSEPGQGTTFKVYFPRVREAEEPAVLPEPVAETVTPRQNNRTALLVEDEALLRSLERQYLEASGYTVLEAKSGAEAIQVAGEHKGPIALLMTDVVMPGMSGRALAEQIAERRPGIKILYVSGYPDQTIARHGVLESNMHFLQKPFSAESLKRKLEELFRP